ncbi:MAG: CHAD domain-containing protein [Desulfobacula sp.]|nr:CHAD domain-containing protein [Desulfobacula sp.]
MHNHLGYILPDKYDQQNLINDLTGDYMVKKEQSMLKCMAYYDTFDWRLFNKGLVLFESENKLFLRRLFKKKIINSTDITSFPVFLQDFNDCELKNILAPLIKMRALIKLVEVHSSLKTHHISNQKEKIITRLIYEEIRLPKVKNKPLLAAYLWLPQIKERSKDFQNMVKRFTQLGFTKHKKKEDIYFKSLAAVKQEPGNYSSKFKIQLDPGMRSDQAAKIIFQYLLKTIKINEINIKKDLDTEFLHDFRVAVRRSRSALGQIKSVFPVETTSRFKKDLAFVGKLTNRLRDLDVCLLQENTYKAELPIILRGNIASLFEHLKKMRLNALKEVITQLESKKYLQIIQNWETFINKPQLDSPVAAKAKTPIIDLAQKRIHKQYWGIVKTGIQIIENMEDEKLHALRIKCKKLRYLMEFFSSLFPNKKIKALIKQLKKLQNNLGSFNDMYVQEQHLMNIALELSATDLNSKKNLMVIGSLMGTLNRKKQVFKSTFPKTFKDFAAQKNKKKFNELCLPK